MTSEDPQGHHYPEDGPVKRPMLTLEEFKATHPVSPAVERAITSKSNLRIRLYDLRADSGLSIKRFARRLGVTKTDVERVEEGDFEGVTVEVLDKYAGALGKVLVVTIRGDGASPFYDLTPKDDGAA